MTTEDEANAQVYWTRERLLNNVAKSSHYFSRELPARDSLMRHGVGEGRSKARRRFIARAAHIAFIMRGPIRIHLQRLLDASRGPECAAVKTFAHAKRLPWR